MTTLGSTKGLRTVSGDNLGIGDHDNINPILSLIPSYSSITVPGLRYPNHKNILLWGLSLEGRRGERERQRVVWVDSMSSFFRRRWSVLLLGTVFHLPTVELEPDRWRSDMVPETITITSRWSRRTLIDLLHVRHHKRYHQARWILLEWHVFLEEEAGGKEREETSVHTKEQGCPKWIFGFKVLFY